MKTKLVQIKDYLLLVDEEAEIRENEHYINTRNKPYINISGNTRFKGLYDKCYKIISYFPLQKEAKELVGLPLLPNPFENEIIEMWMDFNKNHNKNYPLGKEQFIRAMVYKAAQFKQFSLEDIREAFWAGMDYNESPFNSDKVFVDEEEYVQLLTTQQLPKEFIPEYKNRCCGRCDGWKDTCVSDEICPEHKVEGCEICYGERGNQIKTITNTEGKEELVGVYKYYP